MWFFIITLMVIGAFFSGAIFSCIVRKDTETDRKFIKKELKIITDALNACPPPVTFPSIRLYPDKKENESFEFKYNPIPVPDVICEGFEFKYASIPDVTCNDDNKNE